MNDFNYGNCLDSEFSVASSRVSPLIRNYELIPFSWICYLNRTESMTWNPSSDDWLIHDWLANPDPIVDPELPICFCELRQIPEFLLLSVATSSSCLLPIGILLYRWRWLVHRPEVTMTECDSPTGAFSCTARLYLMFYIFIYLNDNPNCSWMIPLIVLAFGILVSF